MPEYILLMYQPTDGGPSPESWGEVHAQWTKFDEDIKAAGAFVANRGLGQLDVATTVRVRNDETQITDGPFAETKEFFAGYYLIDVPDLDSALEWAAKVPSSTYGSTEVRPMWGAGGS
jgi:hypothetical protein